jgi:KaiC/GvpD/RAD55 family RecA-like ATPase
MSELPNDQVTELAVLAAILNGKGDAIGQVRKMIPHPLVFFQRNHRVMAIAIFDLDDQGMPSDGQAVHEWLYETLATEVIDEIRMMTDQIDGHAWTGKRRAWPDRSPRDKESALAAIGGPATILEVASNFRGLSSLSRSTERLWDLYLRRRAIHEMNRLHDTIGNCRGGVFTVVGPVIMRLDAIVRASEKGTEASGLAKLNDRIEALASGRYISPPSGYDILDDKTQWLCAGSVPAIAGPEKSGKSFFVLCALIHLVRNGVSCGLLNLEEDCSFILRRSLAILSGRSDVCNDKWVAMNPDLAKAMAEEHRTMLAQIEASVFSLLEPSIPNAISLVRCELKRGKKVFFIDPVSALCTSKNAWEDAKLLTWSVKKMAEEYGAAVPMVNHTEKQKGPLAGGQSLAHAGGAAFTRFASAVLTIRKNPEPEEMTVRHRIGEDIPVLVHRTLRIEGARNGPGDGTIIAMDLNPETLRMVEMGVVVSDQSTKPTRRRKAIPGTPQQGEDLFK